MQVRRSDPRLPRKGDNLPATHPDRGIRVNVTWIACLRLSLPARHQTLQVQHGVLVALEVSVHRDPARPVTQVQGPPVAAPLHLETEHLSGVGRQDSVTRGPARRDVDPGVQVIVTVLSEGREHAAGNLQGPEEHPFRSATRGGPSPGGGGGAGARRRRHGSSQHRDGQHGQSRDHRRDERRVKVGEPPGEPHGPRIVATKMPGANPRIV